MGTAAAFTFLFVKTTVCREMFKIIIQKVKLRAQCVCECIATFPC